MGVWGWQGERSSRRGPDERLRWFLLVAVIVLPLVLAGPTLAAWAGVLVIASLWSVGWRPLLGWARAWLLFSAVYGFVLGMFVLAGSAWGDLGREGVSGLVAGVLWPLARLLVAVLGIQLLQWTTPPAAIVSGVGRWWPRLALSLTVALRVLPRLEDSARWRLVTAQRRGLVADGRWKGLRARASLWPAWLADGLEHAHDLGDAIQSRGLHRPGAVRSSRLKGDWTHWAWPLMPLTYGVVTALMLWDMGSPGPDPPWVAGAWFVGFGATFPRRQRPLGPPEADEPVAVRTVDLRIDTSIRLPTGRSVGEHTWALEHGQVIGLVGPSGCGKSSLLRVLAGVSPWQHPIMVEGDVAFVEGGSMLTLGDGPPRRPTASWAPQDPARHGLGESVERELRLAGHSRAARERLMDVWGLAGVLERSLETLSDGEQQRALLAAHLDDGQGVWLLDEADGLLDEDGHTTLRARVVEHRDRGGLILLVSHAPDRWDDLVDRWLVWDEEGAVLLGEDQPQAGSVGVAGLSQGEGRAGLAPPERGSAPDGRSLWITDGDLVAFSGGWTIISGDNGVGKSTLFAAWAEVVDAEWMPADPDARLLGLTVGQERGLWTEAGLDAERLGAFEEALGVRVLDASQPAHDASLGERRRLALVPILAGATEAVFIDELDRGLGPDDVHALIAALDDLARAGTAVVVTTHAATVREALAAAGAQHWRLAGGRLSAAAAAEEEA